MTSLAQGRWLLTRVGIASGAYVLLVVVAAASSRLTTGKEPALLLWLLGAGVLFATLVHWAREVSSHSPAVTVMVLACTAAGVVALAFIGFVLMVNMWEQMGLGH